MPAPALANASCCGASSEFRLRTSGADHHARLRPEHRLAHIQHEPLVPVGRDRSPVKCHAFRARCSRAHRPGASSGLPGLRMLVVGVPITRSASSHECRRTSRSSIVRPPRPCRTAGRSHDRSPDHHGGRGRLGPLGAARTLRPLRETTQAALAIAGGAWTHASRAPTSPISRHSLQLSPDGGPTSRTHRTGGPLHLRVNHELRSPLTTLANSLSVLEARRDELPPRALQALDLLGAEVRRFRRLVDELLEISRFDAKPGTSPADEVTWDRSSSTPSKRPAQTCQYVSRRESRHSTSWWTTPFRTDFRQPVRERAALRRRCDTVGHRRSRATPCVSSSRTPGRGIALEERERIFERFSRAPRGGARTRRRHRSRAGDRRTTRESTWRSGLGRGPSGRSSRFVVELLLGVRLWRETTAARRARVPCCSHDRRCGCGLPIDNSPQAIPADRCRSP